MAQKCSERRVILRKLQNLVNEMIQTNEMVARMAADAEDTSLSDVADKMDAILDGCGLATTTNGTGDTTSDIIVGILYGNVTDDTYGALDWSYESE